MEYGSIKKSKCGELEGLRQGGLLVVYDGIRNNRRMLCAHCDCGNVIWIPYTQWVWDKPKNCGCRKKARINDNTKVWVLYDGKVMSAWKFITTVVKAYTVKNVEDLLQDTVKARIEKTYGITYKAHHIKLVLESEVTDGLKKGHTD